MTPRSRRSVLRAFGAGVVGGFAGCLAESDTPARNGTEAAATRSPTIPCSEQESPADITVLNGLPSTRSVEVTITRDGTGSVVFERVYDVPAGDDVQTEVVFEEVASAGSYTATVEVDNGWNTTQDVTTVAQNPFRYGINVELNEQANAVFVSAVHLDPGPNHELGCER